MPELVGDGKKTNTPEQVIQKNNKGKNLQHYIKSIKSLKEKQLPSEHGLILQILMLDD